MATLLYLDTTFKTIAISVQKLRGWEKTLLTTLYSHTLKLQLYKKNIQDLNFTYYALENCTDMQICKRRKCFFLYFNALFFILLKALRKRFISQRYSFNFINSTLNIKFLYIYYIFIYLPAFHLILHPSLTSKWWF